jgi:hypothetical protein
MAPHTPTAAQLTQLAVLQAAAVAATATLKAAQATQTAAQAAQLAAHKSWTDYQAFISGSKKTSAIDEGGPDVL